MEFSPATASAMGLAWTHHEDCRAAMEADFLPALFAHARDMARCSAPAAAEAGADQAGVCGAAVSLLCAVLSWDFRRARRPQRAQHASGAHQGDRDREICIAALLQYLSTACTR